MKTSVNYSPLDPEELNSRFIYKDGGLYYKDNFGQRARKGNRAGWTNRQGYRCVRFGGKNYLEHQIIWAMHNGDVHDYLDHIDGNPLNNSLENLRVAGPSGNTQNAATRIDNTSGAKNVYWNKECRCWRVQLNVNGETKYIGQFGTDFDRAVKAAAQARYKYHGEFASDR